MQRQIPAPVFKGFSELELPSFEEYQTSALSTDCRDDISDACFPPSLQQFFCRRELNGLMRELSLSKE